MPGYMLSLPFRSYGYPGQHTSYVGTGSLQDLSTSSFEQSQKAIFSPPVYRPSRAVKTTALIRRFLLHNLKFTYGIDTASFHNCLDHANCELLSVEEQIYLAFFGRDLQIAHDRVRHNRHSLLGQEDCVSIAENIIEPAQALHIEPGYLCKHLMKFPEHEFNREKRDNAHIFSQVTKKSFLSRSHKWDTLDARFHLARCLVSDDCVVERIAPSRHVQVLIGTCIESFSQKHCKKGVNMGSVNRRIYVAEHTQRMVDAVITRAQQPPPSPQQRNLNPASPRIPNSMQHQPDLPIRQNSILTQAKETPHVNINEADEDDLNRTP